MPAFIVLLVIFLVFGTIFGILLLKYRNKFVAFKERIKNARSNVRIAKAKYLQVIRKTVGAQKSATSAQAEAYKAGGNSSGVFFSGAHGMIEASFKESSELVSKLANQYEESQKKLNEVVQEYNTYISKFPSTIFAGILRYKKEEYIDNENLEASAVLQGFDENDI